MAGLAIGLAIASRYLMAALIPVLLATDVLVLWRQTSQRENPKTALLGAGAGVLAVAGAFVLTSPYVFLDFNTAWNNVTAQANSPQIGADGLSRGENFVWYLTDVIPSGLTGAVTILAAVGAALVVWRRRPKQILLLVLAGAFLVAISYSNKHWERWIVPILPLFALFAAYTLDTIIGHLSARLTLKPFAQLGLLLLAVLLVAAQPAYDLVLHDIRNARPSTRILAREWMLDNLPPGSRIKSESYTAPFLENDHPFELSGKFTLATGEGWDHWFREGYQYQVASSWQYERFFGRPDRSPVEIAFYETLFAEGHLVKQFEPSRTR